MVHNAKVMHKIIFIPGVPGFLKLHPRELKYQKNTDNQPGKLLEYILTWFAPTYQWGGTQHQNLVDQYYSYMPMIQINLTWPDPCMRSYSVLLT